MCSMSEVVGFSGKYDYLYDKSITIRPNFSIFGVFIAHVNYVIKKARTDWYDLSLLCYDHFSYYRKGAHVTNKVHNKRWRALLLDSPV